MDTKIDSLKKLQLELLSKEAEYHQQVHSLEVEFQKQVAEIHIRRRQIVNGNCTAEKEQDEPETAPTEQSKGVPEFWLGVFKRTPVLRAMINPIDATVLAHLADVRSVVVDEPNPGFVLEFEFEQNDFFDNNVLTKEYKMKCVPDPDQPSSFNGFEIYDTVGCKIDWKQGVNPFAASEIGIYTITNSFFDFFNPKELFEKFENPAMFKECMETDFEIGFYLKERVIPRAVLFFIGECEDTESDLLEDVASRIPDLAELSE